MILPYEVELRPDGIFGKDGYPPGDAADQASRQNTRQPVFVSRSVATAMSYFTYGSSFMVNVTSEEPGVGAGVLLCALEPLEGAYNRQESIGKSSSKRFGGSRLCILRPS